jgi:hypothetical protein
MLWLKLDFQGGLADTFPLYWELGLGQKTGYEALNIWVLEMRVGVKLSVLIPFKRGPSVY